MRPRSLRSIRSLRAFHVLLALLLWGAVGLTALAGRAAEEEKGVLADLISRALSTPATQVTIGAIDGALSSDATIRDIRISDRDGVWLKLDRARIVWRRLALLQRRLEIDTLEVGTLDVARRPIPAEAPVAGENQPLLPELPVKVEIKDFKLATLALGEPILGQAARLGATGSARLGNPQEGLDLRFDARRLDAGGTFTVRFGLVPQGQRLTLAVVLDEPAGGLLSRLGKIPGEPPVKLDLTGSGTLDAFASKLTFDAGPGIGAAGSATIERDGALRRIGLDLEARIAGLLPDVAAPVFAGTTQLVGKATYGDDGAIVIPGITLTAAAARLDIGGGVRPDQVVDLRVTAASLPNAGASARTAVSGAEIRRLAFDARAQGPIAGPSVTATLDAEDVRLPAGRLARLVASASATPIRSDGASRFVLAADAKATGIAPADRALGTAIGGEASVTLRGSASAEGIVAVDTLEAKTPTLAARYAGRLGASELQGRLDVGAADLSRFADLAGLALTGSATLGADLEGTPRAHRINAKLEAKATRFATGIAAVDGLFGGALQAAGTARLGATGTVAFEEMRLTGQNVSVRLDGSAAPDLANLTLAGTVPDLRKVDGRLSGKASLTGQLTGSLKKPDATLRVAIADGTALGRPMPRLVLDGTARDLTGALDARVTLDGEIDRKPARGRLHVARPAGGGTVVDGIDVAIGSAQVTGGATLDAQNLAAGQVSIRAPNLDDLSALALTKLTGSLTADIAAAVQAGGQNATVKATGARIAGFGASIDRLQADLTLTDVYRRPVIAGSVAIDDAAVAGERIGKARLTAQGTAQASDVTLTATARGFDLDARARVVPGERTRIEIQQFGATRDGRRIALAGPATITLVEGGIDIRSFALGFGTGRLTVDGVAGSRLDLAVAARAVPLSAADILSPGLGLAGTFEGEARIAGTPSSPSGDYRARVTGLAAPQTRNLGLPPAEIAASGKLGGGRATLDATIAAGRAGSLRIAGSVPVGGQGALDLAVKGGIDAGVATTGLLAAGGRRLTGRVEVDARVGGTLAAPQASGAATLAGGSFTDALQGTQLTNIRARLVARGEEIAIESGSATARNGGTLTASGRIRLDPAAGFPGQIRVAGQRAELIRSGIATAVANLSLDLSGALARAPRISGRVEVVSLDVAVPERLSGALAPLPNTRHVNPTPTTRARLALAAKAAGRQKGGRAAPPFDASLDVTLAAPGSVIVVRGRGLNVALGGNLKVTGTLAKPVANGGFDLRQGSLQIVSSRLDFSRGRLSFSGDLTPELDFVASTQAGGATIQIAVEGQASDPTFQFTSSPDLPRDEILSRLLFNSPSGQLTTGQALALAQAAAQFSGAGGSGPFEDLRRSLGLSGLDLNLGAAGGPGAGLTKGLNDRVSVGAHVGATPAQTGFGVDVRITDQVRLKGDIGATGATSLGIGAEYEW